MSELTTDNQVSIIEKSIDVFKEGGVILKNNQDRSGKALAVGNSILSTIKELGGITSEEMDERCKNYLANCSKANKEMKEARSQVTQLMDSIKKMFTEVENNIDAAKPETVPCQIQKYRDGYARKLLQEQEQRRKEAEEKAAKAKEEVDIRTFVKNQIAGCLLSFLSKKKISITNSFNAISLADFPTKSENLKAMGCAFPQEKLRDIVSTFSLPAYFRHTQDEVSGFVNQELDSYDYSSFYQEYGRQITELKDSLVDKLQSKKEELDAMARADENEKIRLENERINREAEENARLQREAELQQKKAEEELELQRSAGNAQILFDQAVEAAVVPAAPEARTGYEIQVLHVAGWVEIFQFWFQREGCKMSVEDMGKKSLNQMKAFAESVAKKDDVKIESKYLAYETAVKSVNRKTVIAK